MTDTIQTRPTTSVPDWGRFETTRNLAPYMTGPPLLRSANAVETEVLFIVEPERHAYPADPAATVTDLVPGMATEPPRPRRHRGEHRRPAPRWTWAVIGFGAGAFVWPALTGAILWTLA